LLTLQVQETPVNGSVLVLVVKILYCIHY